MRFNTFKSVLIKSGLAASVLLLASGASFAQSVSLTAAASTTTMPDGSVVPMWGYQCSTTVAATGATCAAANPAVQAAFTAVAPATPAWPSWSPVVITVPYNSTGTNLAITLTNGLPASVAETSLVIVGQLGGGLGTTATSTPSPAHATQSATWPIANSGPTNTPPPQGNRVQSFSTPATHTTAVTLNWTGLKPGTYLIESGTHPSIQGPMGLYGILIVTTAPVGATAGTAYPAVGTTAAVTYNAEIPLLLSEIDPVQNNAVKAAVTAAGFSETLVWSGQPGQCGNPTYVPSAANPACYPPAVNYTPLYYLVNGVAFNGKSSATSAANSLFAPLPPSATSTTLTGNVLVRLVNAGLRMHVPSIVGSVTTPAIVPTGVTAAAVPGFSLVAEDGNRLPGVSRVQSEVFLAAGKTYDVMINAPAACTPVPCTTPALPVFDRELSLSGNATGRDEGMLAYLKINGGALPAAATTASATVQANPDTYNSVIAGQTLTVSDPGKGLLANDVNVYGVQVIGTAPAGLTLHPDGTFVYTGGVATTFNYCGNGALSGAACATVTLGIQTAEAATGITCTGPAPSYTSTVAGTLSIKPPGILAGCKDALGYALTVNAASVAPSAGLTVSVDPNGGFNASGASGTFTFKPQNSQGVIAAAATTVSVTFPTATGLGVTLIDGATKAALATQDYRWIIEEDRTFYVNPNCTTNPPAAGCPGTGTAGLGVTGIVPTFGTNFHTSYMPVVAAGCTGPLSCESGQTLGGVGAVCDVGNGVCRTTASQQSILLPSAVHLDPTKHYYISVLPGDAANSFENKSSCLSNPTPSCGHGMGGAPIACVPTTGNVACTATAGTGAFPSNVNVIVQPNPFPPSKLSVFVFEDDFPLNGEQDGGGGIDVVSPNEPGLGGFNITLFDDAGGPGDATGQMTYDMFNMPLSNGLAGTIDPATGLDACPVSGSNQNVGFDGATASPTGITGTIVTCPKYEADGKTLSPLAGQAVVSNLMPGRYGVVATPAADRIARGEEWLQTNTLDGQKAHDSFLRVGEPSFFQEYGPAGFHVTIGFANPAIINARKQYICSGADPNSPQPGTPYTCNNTITGTVTTERMSRTPDERLYSSGDNSSFAFTQCYVSFGDADGEDFAFTKCDANGSFTLSGLPQGDWRVTVFDQWNDMLVDGLSTPVRLAGGATVNLGQMPTNQWQSNIYTSTFLDTNGNGVRDANEPGLALVATNNRFRDGSYSNFNNTDLSGNAGFNEIFPLFSWYVIETDTTRYKSTGVHVVYDAGGPSDGSANCALAPTGALGNSNIAHCLANAVEQIPLPTNLRVPGAFYCANADCTDAPTPLNHPAAATPYGTGGSTGRVDPPLWFGTEGWQGFSGENNILEFGKKPYVAGETGGIHGEVTYASTRPFDDPALLIHTSWTPNVPGVTINLYKEGFAADGVTPTLTLVDHTTTSSFDDWAQGFRSDGVPNMNCPGQGRDTGTNADLFFFSIYNQPNWLDQYKNGGTAAHQLPNNSQFKCYDGMHNWNQVQPAPFDGMYSFPSITAFNPTTGKPAGTNCTACVTNPDASDPYRYGGSATPVAYNGTGAPMLPAGKYVVEVVVPPGYELVKEEDKNILIGDNYIAPVTQEFAGLGNVFILPDQAQVSAYYNAANPQNPTTTFGRTTFPSKEGDTGSVETFWPCVGASRIVPDYISLFPQSLEVAPFAGARRNLCDRKEVTLTDQTAALAKFWIFSSTHVAAHFTGVITDDFTSEFDPFSPQFGEKFSPPDLPISIKDWSGTEIARTYADHWGAYNGLTYSTWEVNPPNPTGYAPTMMVTCMNDPGTGVTPDPLFNPQYSQFCYEIPFMPGQTQYMDTPVTPTSAFAGAGYNNPDCAYPALTPAISEVDGDAVAGNPAGPWVSAAGHTLTITALGDQLVPNNAYSGPAAHAAPFNQKKVTRHYGFGATQGSGKVTIGGVPATVTGWNDKTITVTVPTIPSSASTCPIQQQAQYGGPGTTGVTTAVCGELAITTGTGQQSIDTVTVTVGGKAPTHIAATASIQAAIDAAKPGDMLIIDPVTRASGGVPAVQAVHQEMLLMWKPVRLQGVGAASSVLNANTHPAGKLDTWRAKVNCLFGLGLNGSPKTWSNSCGKTAGTTWFGFVATATNPQVDRLPLEATIGWDATLSGNLAELLQEPSLMGALEGAGITVLSKGVNLHGSTPWDPTLQGGFPVGTTLLINSTNSSNCGSNTTSAHNAFPSSFQCNPSSIDGLSITDSSQGGGGIFVHGWGHNLQIANDRVYNNAGTLSGGINVGQGEFPPSYIQGSATNSPPGSCLSGGSANIQLPYCHNLNVSLHNNAITSNSSTGDELFSATPAGAGGVSICTGSDFYKFNYNWVCGNLSTGDGGGIGHLGFSYGGDIEHNSILFNQSTNPTIATNGGGLLVMGAPDADPPCGNQVDTDCVPALGSVGPSDGIGPGLVINANLIMGNSAESGSGGGIAFQGVNGTDVISFPNGSSTVTFPGISGSQSPWYSPLVTNNIIVNNVAGWDGAGISLLDALNVNILNNTIVSNDTTASSGVLFNTLGAPLASTQGPCPPGQIDPATGLCKVPVLLSTPQPAGLVSIQNSSTLVANYPGTLTCPAGHFSGTTASNGTCANVSFPLLVNNMFWQNRDFHIAVGALGGGTLNQQNIVGLLTALNVAPASQTATGACVAGSTYWDIGVRGDTGPALHGSTVTLAPRFSVLTDAADYPAANNLGTNPAVISQYCNGSRIPPEFGGTGYQVPPGISDATVPNPIFSLTPAATVDEGNNWVNMSWGPLAETNPVTNVTLGNYAIPAASPAVNAGTSATQSGISMPTTDFFGLPRTPPNDIGAVEFNVATLVPTPGGNPPNSANFGNWVVGNASLAMQFTYTNISPNPITTTTVVLAGAGYAITFNGCVAQTLQPGNSCAIAVQFTPTSVATFNATLTVNGAVPTSINLTGAGIAPSATLVRTAGPVAFGNVAVGSVSLQQQYTYTNTSLASTGGVFTITGAGTTLTEGTPPVNATNFSDSGTGIFPTNCVNGLVLNPGNSCTINVQFNPKSVGTFTGTLTVTGPAQKLVTFTGTGTLSAVTISAPNPALTTATANRNTKQGVITVGNSGPGTVTLTAAPTVTPRAGSAGTFSQFTPAAGTLCAANLVLAAGASCVVGVQYVPPATGTPIPTVTATFSVMDTGAGTTPTAVLTQTATFNAN